MAMTYGECYVPKIYTAPDGSEWHWQFPQPYCELSADGTRLTFTLKGRKYSAAADPVPKRAGDWQPANGPDEQH